MMPFEPLDQDLVGLRLPLGSPEPEAPRTIEPAPDVFGPAFRTQNIVGSILSSQTGTGRFKRDPEHNPLDTLKGTKYEEDYLDEFVGSRSLEETQAIMAKIDREERDRETLARAGLPGVVAQVAAGIIDPTIAIPGGTVVRGIRAGALGFSTFRSAAKVGAFAGVGAAMQEVHLV
jgi:hypothetical protein